MIIVGAILVLRLGRPVLLVATLVVLETAVDVLVGLRRQHRGSPSAASA